MAVQSIPGIEAILRQKVVEERKTYKQISVELRREYAHLTRGLSGRSIRRYCNEKHIHPSSQLTASQLDRVVSSSVAKVGATYGRKMMTGFLSAQGIRCSEKRVGHSLKRVSPGYHAQRESNTHRQTNPVPYRADYFGQKVHIDQNEKLVMFGITHVCAVDGYSGMIVGFATMARKNNPLIYQYLYMDILTKFGLWDQLRVDHGREWCLMLYINSTLSHLRGDTSKQPHVQTSSTKNHTVERLWVEVNSRVNYPIKEVLVDMLEREEFSMDDPTTQFCISSFLMQIINVGVSSFVSSWNAHPIPGRGKGMARGVPTILMGRDNRAQRLPPSMLPSVEQAVQMYRDNVGTLTDPTLFGIDPLADNSEKKQIRERAFISSYPSYDSIFHDLVNGITAPFRKALLFYLDVTKRLSSS